MLRQDISLIADGALVGDEHFKYDNVFLTAKVQDIYLARSKEDRKIIQHKTDEKKVDNMIIN